MINSSLNNGVCKGQQMSDLDKRLDAVEEELKGYKKSFGSLSITTDDLTSANSHIGKADATSLNATSIKAVSINTDNLDIDNSISVENVNVASQLNANKVVANKANVSELTSASASITNANIDDLKVGRISATDNNMPFVNITVSGTANINKLNLGDPHIDTIVTPTLSADVANIDRGTVVSLDGVVEEKVDTIKLNKGISRGDSLNVNMIKPINTGSMQVGDKENQVILAGDSRPLWNDKVLATLDDLGDKIVPAYKGRIPTEAELPLDGTLGDYYIITMLTKDGRSGIGYALYNGTQFDTDFFYELDGYRLEADQDVIDNAQDVAIANEISRAKAKEEDLFNNGVKKIKASAIAGNNLNIDLLRGDKYFGEKFTGFGRDFIDGTIPEGAEDKSCELSILQSDSNTIQIYSTVSTFDTLINIRSYDGTEWTPWQRYLKDNDAPLLKGGKAIEENGDLNNCNKPGTWQIDQYKTGATIANIPRELGAVNAGYVYFIGYAVQPTGEWQGTQFYVDLSGKVFNRGYYGYREDPNIRWDAWASLANNLTMNNVALVLKPIDVKGFSYTRAKWDQINLKGYGNYFVLLSMERWQDNTDGGAAAQIAISQAGDFFVRTGKDANTWFDWKKVAYVADKVADSERLEGRTLLELRQMLFDDAHPIKDTFVSNDGADDPNAIYNVNGITSTWEYIGQSFGIHGWRRTK